MRYNRGKYNRKPYNRPNWTRTIEVEFPETKVGFLAPIAIVRTGNKSLRISGTVSRNGSDAMYRAELDFDKAATGTAVRGKSVLVELPDHTGTDRAVFYGLFPSENAIRAPGGDKETFIGLDHGFYLTNQYPDASQQVLLKPEDQNSENYQRMYYDHTVANFTVGKYIEGQTSGATARVVATQGTWVYGSGGESYLVPTSALVLSEVTGTFQDDEVIKEIASSGEAYVDGTLIPMDFGASEVIYPEDWIRNALGADNWYTKSRVYPKRLNPTHPLAQDPSNEWTEAPYKEYRFQRTQTLDSCCNEIADHHNFVHLVKWGYLTWYGYVAMEYFVHQQDIDNPDDYAYTEHRGLDLPDPVTITKPDAYLVGDSIRIDVKGDQKYNKVVVRGRDLDGIEIESQMIADIAGNEDTCTCTAGVYAGTDPVIMPSPEMDEALTTQEQVNARAHLAYLYASQEITVYTCTFIKRVDFQYFQKLIFSGYGTKIPDGTYRIADISINWRAADYPVTVKLIDASRLDAQLKIKRYYVDALVETARLVEKRLKEQPPAALAGSVKSSEDGKVTILTKSGQTITSQDLT